MIKSNPKQEPPTSEIGRSSMEVAAPAPAPAEPPTAAQPAFASSPSWTPEDGLPLHPPTFQLKLADAEK